MTEISKIYSFIVIGGGKIGGPKKGEVRSKEYQAKRTRKEKGMGPLYLSFFANFIVIRKCQTIIYDTNILFYILSHPGS